MNTKLSCNKCKRQIKIKQKHTKIIDVETDIQRMYFKCPHCNTKYTIAYTNTEFRENIEKIKIITVKLGDRSILKEEVDSLIREQSMLVSINKEISQKYREIYDKEVS